MCDVCKVNRAFYRNSQYAKYVSICPTCLTKENVNADNN